MAANLRWYEDAPETDGDHDSEAIPEIPEPIYMSRKAVEAYMSLTHVQYTHHEEDELSDAEEGEDENLDLTAPPLES